MKLFWKVLAGMSPAEQCALLRFATSCSRPPLGGFQYLQPPLTIHKVRMRPRAKEWRQGWQSASGTPSMPVPKYRKSLHGMDCVEAACVRWLTFERSLFSRCIQ